MAALLVKKLYGALHPVDEEGEDTLSRIKHGELLRVQFSRPRNVQHHRLFFALLKIVADNSPRYDAPDQVLTALKIALGHVETIIGHDGRTYYVPRSISFAKMDQDAFARFFDRSVDIVARKFLPGVSDRELRREVEAMCGIQSGAAA